MKYVMFRCVAKTKIVVLKSAAAQTCQVLVHCLRGDSIYTTKMPWMVVWVGNYVAMNFMTAACNRDGFYVFKLPCGFVWVCIQNDECDRGWRWLTMLQWHDMDLYEHWYYPSWYWQHALLYCTWKVSPICVYLNSWQHEVLLNDLDWKHIGDRPRRMRGAFSVRICKGMLLWSLKSWQHKCYSTSWLYKTHKQEVMHKLGSKHNIQSWVAFSLGHDSYSRSQCTQKKFTFFTFFYIAYIGKRFLAWYGIVPLSCTMLQITS